jgi:(1->4)-alpha-D-glucan 1-alpha-D-glucosylmutase
MAVPFRATYRLQFHKDFTFADAVAQLPYLSKLGISHVYASPILMARAGSTHGYDGVDPSRINPELGGEDGFSALVAGCRAAGLGLIIDIVPNHLAVDSTNPLWMEVLELGQSAPAADVFDIDWAKGPIVIPTLGKTLNDALKDGEITLKPDWENGRILVAYFDNRWPLRSESVAAVLQLAEKACHPLGDIVKRWQALESGDIAPPEEIIAAREALRALDEEERHHVVQALERQDLKHLLGRQHWLLTHWRAESDRLTYRRFFNITGLIGVRVEDQAVFERIHERPLAMVRSGEVDGLRIDHVDGLADPSAYCAQLRAAVRPDTIILIEKILGRAEPLRDWPITGTTGYERLNDINGLFVAPDGWRKLDAYLVGKRILAAEPAERLATAKAFMLRTSFVAEVNKLGELAARLAQDDPEAADFGASTLRDGVVALLIRFGVYRSYGPDTGSDPLDRAPWQAALNLVASRDNPWVTEAARYLVRRVEQVAEPLAAEFVRRFQQLSGPAMAKGLEDTEFYRSVALTSVNEVGGDLAEPWREAEDFHAIFAARANEGKQDSIPLATHDTKRGPETRARINVLSLWADDWIEAFESWHKLNAPLRRCVAGESAPDAIDEWLIYQTLLGTWPISPERLAEYLTKAMREAKRKTFWDNPNEAYEAAVQCFAKALLTESAAAPFRAQLQASIAAVEPVAKLNAIAQTILQLTLPGTPDLYQGTEFWDHSLVDPDNRRPVDYAARAAVLAEAPGLSLAGSDPGFAKLGVTHRLLAFRAAHLALFQHGDYQPVLLDGGWVGFTRGQGGRRLLVVVPTRGIGGGYPVLPADLGNGWQDLLTGRPMEAGHLADWPFIVASRVG